MYINTYVIYNEHLLSPPLKHTHKYERIEGCFYFMRHSSKKVTHTHVQIYIQMYIYVCMYVYIYVCIEIYKYVCVYIYIYTYMFTRIRTHIHTY